MPLFCGLRSYWLSYDHIIILNSGGLKIWVEYELQEEKEKKEAKKDDTIEISDNYAIIEENIVF